MKICRSVNLAVLGFLFRRLTGFRLFRPVKGYRNIVLCAVLVLHYAGGVNRKGYVFIGSAVSRGEVAGAPVPRKRSRRVGRGEGRLYGRALYRKRYA